MLFVQGPVTGHVRNVAKSSVPDSPPTPTVTDPTDPLLSQFFSLNHFPPRAPHLEGRESKTRPCLWILRASPNLTAGREIVIILWSR